MRVQIFVTNVHIDRIKNMSSLEWVWYNYRPENMVLNFTMTLRLPDDGYSRKVLYDLYTHCILHFKWDTSKLCMFAYFLMKNCISHMFELKNLYVHLLLQSRFYTPKIIFFPIAEGGAKIFGVFRVINHDFTPKNQFFSNFRGSPPPGSAPGIW
jgi:hypothetical protein